MLGTTKLSIHAVKDVVKHVKSEEIHLSATKFSELTLHSSNVPKLEVAHAI